MENNNIILLVKILESNMKLLNSYKKVIKKIDDLEENIIIKFKDKDNENTIIRDIINESNDNYYKISLNCLD